MVCYGLGLPISGIFIFLVYQNVKGPGTIPTIVVLGPKVESNVVSIVQFFVLIGNVPGPFLILI